METWTRPGSHWYARCWPAPDGWNAPAPSLAACAAARESPAASFSSVHPATSPGISPLTSKRRAAGTTYRSCCPPSCVGHLPRGHPNIPVPGRAASRWHDAARACSSYRRSLRLPRCWSGSPPPAGVVRLALDSGDRDFAGIAHEVLAVPRGAETVSFEAVQHLVSSAAAASRTPQLRGLRARLARLLGVLSGPALPH